MKKISLALVTVALTTFASLAFGAGTASADEFYGRYSSKSECERVGRERINVPSAAYSKFRCTYKGGWMLYLYNRRPR